MTETIWTSHRGYCDGGATENTRASFDAARQLGFLSMETDLQTTRDGEIVLHHDANLLRTFGAEGKIVDRAWTEIKDLQSPDGQTILRLDDLYEAFGHTKWIFDIKPYSEAKTLSQLKRWSGSPQRAEWLATHVRFLFWSQEGGRQGRKDFPSTPQLAQERACYRAGLSALCACPSLGGIKAATTYSLPAQFAGQTLFTRRIVDAYRHRGAQVLAYLPATELLAKKAFDLGFDEILTNGPKYF